MPRNWLVALSAVVLSCAILFSARVAQSGIESPVAAVLTAVQIPLDAIATSIAGTIAYAVSIPSLSSRNALLKRQNVQLSFKLDLAQEALSRAPRDRAIALLTAAYRGSIAADCIGYNPENTERSVTLDQGSLAGVTLDAGVMNEQGVVGRIVAVTPLSSTVLLLDAYTSYIPAIVQQGRYWGIARGSLAHIHLDEVALDANLKLGERVVTGRGRSFPAGITIGTIIAISRSDAALTQTAVVAPSVTFSRLERVLILPHLNP